MIKKPALTACILCLWAICPWTTWRRPPVALAEAVTVDRALLESILKRQDALESQNRGLREEIEALKRRVPPDPTGGPATTPEAATEGGADTEALNLLRTDADDLSDRLDVVEKRTLMDRLELTGELRATMEYLDMDDLLVDGAVRDARLEELWSTRLRLNARAAIVRDLIFHGRFTYLKYWGETDYDPDYYDTYRNAQPHQEGDFHVERAYIDYFIPDTPLALTIGRLPLSNGPPYEFKNLTTRKATWPQFFVDGEYDGIIATMALDRFTGLSNNYFRLGYAKLSQDYQKARGMGIDAMRAGYAALEADVPGVKDSLLWIGAYKVFDVTPLGDIPGAPAPDDAGGYENYTLHIQFDDILGTGLGWFGALCYQSIHPRNAGTVLAPGYEIGLYGDTLHGDLGERRDAHAIYTGLRYILPIDQLKRPQIGFEYNYGSRYWLPGAIAGDEYTNKLALKGSAYELYYLQPILARDMFCRLGAIYYDYDYFNPFGFYGSMEGDEVRSRTDILHAYFLLDVRF